jgi:Family of unknown function (DUF5977)
MALPLNGVISLSQIAVEFGQAANVPISLNIRTLNAKRQVFINNVWQDCNMCSPVIPSDVVPHPITKFYGYNHAAQGIATIDITGTFAVTANVAQTYTAVLTGGNLGGTVSWDKFENGVWTLAVATGLTPNIAFANPTGAQLRATHTENCNGTSPSVTKPVSNAVVAPSNVVAKVGGLTGNFTKDNNSSTVIDLTYSGGAATGIVWTVSAPLPSYYTITGQGTTQITVTNNMPDVANLASLGITATVTNSAGQSTTAATIFISTNTYTNQAQSGVATKSCIAGYEGTDVTYNVAAGTYTAFSLFDANTLAINDVNANKQGYANANGQCNLIFDVQTFSPQWFQNTVVFLNDYVYVMKAIVTMPAGHTVKMAHNVPANHNFGIAPNTLEPPASVLGNNGYEWNMAQSMPDDIISNLNADMTFKIYNSSNTEVYSKLISVTIPPNP